MVGNDLMKMIESSSQKSLEEAGKQQLFYGAQNQQSEFQTMMNFELNPANGIQNMGKSYEDNQAQFLNNEKVTTAGI